MTNVPSSTVPVWHGIIGEELSGVSFIRNYVRFEFNPPPMVDALTRTVVATSAGSAALGEPAFADLAVSLIGKVVEAVELNEGEAFTIRFAGGSLIAISLQLEEAVGPEAVLIHGHGRKLQVI